MATEQDIRRPATPAPIVAIDHWRDDRRQTITDMTSALIDLYGAAALSIARSQPNGRDVAGNSGIYWQELADALRAN